jgi:hypothetical protein
MITTHNPCYQQLDDLPSFFFPQIVNLGSDTVNLKISVSGLSSSINALGSSSTVMTSSNLMDENSFSNPTKVQPLLILWYPCFYCNIPISASLKFYGS